MYDLYYEGRFYQFTDEVITAADEDGVFGCGVRLRITDCFGGIFDGDTFFAP